MTKSGIPEISKVQNYVLLRRNWGIHSQKHMHKQVLYTLPLFTSACTLKTVGLVTLHRSLSVQELHSIAKRQTITNHTTAKIQKNSVAFLKLLLVWKEQKQSNLGLLIVLITETGKKTHSSWSFFS